MRQLITRIDDELHAALVARAKAEGRSVAALVREVLTATTTAATDRSASVDRLARSGMVVRPEAPADPPTYDEIRSLTRGVGRVASEALAAERAAR